MMVLEHNSELVDDLAPLQPKTVDDNILEVWEIFG